MFPLLAYHVHFFLEFSSTVFDKSFIALFYLSLGEIARKIVFEVKKCLSMTVIVSV